MSDRLPRCTEPGCPVRYVGGPDRLCPEHDEDGDIAAAARALGIELSQAPGAPGAPAQPWDA